MFTDLGRPGDTFAVVGDRAIWFNLCYFLILHHLYVEPTELQLSFTISNQIKSNQIYFSTTFNIAYMCTYLQFKLLYIVNAQCGHLIAKWLSS